MANIFLAALSCSEEVMQSNGFIDKNDFIEFASSAQSTNWKYIQNMFDLYIDQKITLVNPSIGWACNNQKGYTDDVKEFGAPGISVFDLSNEELALQLIANILESSQVVLLNEEIRKELNPEIVAALK